MAMSVCDRCGRKYEFMHFCIQDDGPYPEYNQDRAVLAEVVRMNGDAQSTMHDVLPAACLMHLTRLANNNGQTQPGEQCRKEDTMGQLEESAWLVERNDRGRPEWFSLIYHPGSWTTDSMHALRFAREFDATEFAKVYAWKEKAIATEHVWTCSAQPGPRGCDEEVTA